jgi:hypothetical protein
LLTGKAHRRSLRFAPVGMTKCEADDYLEMGDSDGKIRRTEFFRKLFSRAVNGLSKVGL